MSQYIIFRSDFINLVDNSYEDFYYIVTSVIDDNQGGHVLTEKEQKKFRAVLRRDRSAMTENAEKPEKTACYTITTKRNIDLKFNDLIRRKSDGKFFRITSDSVSCPENSGLDMRQVTAEERMIHEPF
ncbi:MAG: hypothetical protein K2G36_01450 [Ruminococcus sp.]|nr:hypothetical protein [Ruminococcus sp.]